MVQQVNSADFNKILQGGGAVLADFYSDTCVPCRRMAPIFEQLAEESNGSFKSVKVNVSSEGDLAARYDVMAVPTFILFNNGSETERIIGAVTKEELAAMTARNRQ